MRQPFDRPAGRRTRGSSWAATRLLSLLVGTLLAVLLWTSGVAIAQSSWLDAPVEDWNVPGRPIPRAPAGAPVVNQGCPPGRPPESPREQAIVDAGWKLYGNFSRGGAVEEMSGLAGYDGMCRPVEYQYFFFVDGIFAGTLSPIPMISRSDGALNALEIRNDEDVTVRYARYTPQDPLCCPSATTTALFKIDRSGSAPTVSLRSLTTTPNGPMPPAPSPSPGPTVVATPAPARPPVQAPVQLPR